MKTAQINQFASPAPGSVNSYWIEAENGVVLIDAQRQISVARSLIQDVQKTGKEITAILLTHGHPDHIGALEYLATQFPNATCYSTEAVIRAIRNDDGGFIAFAKSILKDDFSGSLPTNVVELIPGMTTLINGLEFLTTDIGKGEASAMATFFMPKVNALFCGDLVQYQMRPFLLEGRTSDWLKQIDKCRSSYGPSVKVFPGHGASGGIGELLMYQQQYLEFVRAKASEISVVDDMVMEGEILQAVLAIEQRFPVSDEVAEIPDLQVNNVKAVMKELSSVVEPAVLADNNDSSL